MLANAAIEQVEHLLKNQDTVDTSRDAVREDTTSAYVANTLKQPLPNAGDYLNTQDRLQDSRTPGGDSSQNGANNGDDDFTWEMIGLGLEEPLPPQDVMDELYVFTTSPCDAAVVLTHRTDIKSTSQKFICLYQWFTDRDSWLH